MIKKGLSIFLLLFLIFPVHSQNIPEELFGIWEGKDRFVFIEKSQENENPQLYIVLKEFYGWYFDRSAEPENAALKETRIRNSGTPRKAENIGIDFKELSKVNKGEGAWEIILQYSKFEKSYIPVAVIDNKIYLNFYYKYLSDKELKEISENKYKPYNNGFYRGTTASDGITVNAQKPAENIGLLNVDGNKYFDIRYWQTDMDYSPDYVSYKRDNYSFEVSKHLISGNTIYSCVSGRSKKIRNPMLPFVFDENNFIFSKYKTILAPEQKPYLIKVADKNTFEHLMEIVKNGNSRRAPLPPPLFPEDNLDFHWDMILELEKYNLQVQKVRQEQKEFELWKIQNNK